MVWDGNWAVFALMLLATVASAIASWGVNSHRLRRAEESLHRRATKEYVDTHNQELRHNIEELQRDVHHHDSLLNDLSKTLHEMNGKLSILVDLQRQRYDSK